MATHVSPRVSSKSSARFIIAALAAIIIISRSGPVARFVQAEGSPIVAENALTGNPASEWDVSGAGDPTIQGFATDISVNTGETVYFKVKTDSTNYAIDIYRLGYYGGAGARQVATVTPSATLPQAQPPCVDRRDDRPGRLRQLGRLGVVVDRPAPCRASTSRS